MPQIQISTTQNVQIEYSTANIGIRILSQLIDFTILFIYTVSILTITSSLKLSGPSILVILLPVFFYSFIMESIFHGQSFGKMILKIKVVRLDGSQASILQYFIRWIFRLIDTPFYGLIGIISIVMSNKGQRIGDKAAGTTVVSLQKKYDFKNSIYRAVQDDYQVQFPQVELLTEKDIHTINEVMNHYMKNPDIQSRHLMVQAKQAIQKRAGIESAMDSLPFLKTILKDYNYILRNEMN
jgi:uncharacterized RDD family membrane protein YckC